MLSAAQISEIAETADRIGWVNGDVSAGGSAAEVKKNQQLPADHEDTRRLGQSVIAALNHKREFATTAFPKRACPPTFNRYESGMAYGNHVDAAIMPLSNLLRTDVAFTLFLSDPATYDGGELVIRMVGGETPIKLPAGSAVCYPPYFVHRVQPVTRGVRIAAIGWVESLISNAEQRAVLNDLSVATANLQRNASGSDELTRVNNVFQTLLRMWADT